MQYVLGYRWAWQIGEKIIAISIAHQPELHVVTPARLDGGDLGSAEAEEPLDLKFAQP
jgi:hypothetical protein